jgi:uncharacterized protein YjbJ (UPF0337 family)
MSTEDKAKNKAEGALGSAKEKLGRATDDERLEGEGQAEQSKSDLKQAGEREMRIVQTQDELADPSRTFDADRLR